MYSGRGLAPCQGPETVCTFHMLTGEDFFSPASWWIVARKCCSDIVNVGLIIGFSSSELFIMSIFSSPDWGFRGLTSPPSISAMRFFFFFFNRPTCSAPPLTSRCLHLTFTRIHMHAAFCSISNSCHGRFYTLVLRGGDNGDTRGVGGRGGRGGRATLFLIILPAVPVFFQRRGFVLAAGCSGFAARP